MHDHPVVPEDHVVDLPLVAVGEFGAHRMGEQIVEDRTAFLLGHALDLTGEHLGYPELFVVANRDEDGNLLETAETARQWHSDHSFTPKPAIGSILYCRQMPETGGTTMYTNMYRAYETLSEPFKKMIEGMRAIHDVNNVAQLKNRKPRSREELDSTPPVSQPMVITHPVSGRKALYVSEMFTRQFFSS